MNLRNDSSNKSLTKKNPIFDFNTKNSTRSTKKEINLDFFHQKIQIKINLDFFQNFFYYF